MLKIKDDVDLKELEKFGFKKDKDLSDGIEEIWSKKENYQTICIEKKSKLIALREPFNSNTFILNCNILYDLIQLRISRKSLAVIYSS